MSLRWSRTITTVAVLVSLLLIGTVAACGQESEETATFDHHLRNSKIYNKPKIVIGVETKLPFMSFKDPKSGKYSGFDIDIARLIAEPLGFRGDTKIEWLDVITANRETVLHQGVVDLVVASFSITQRRESDGIRFAGPYLVTTQAVLIRADRRDEIGEIEDLRKPGVQLCVPGDSTAEAEWERRGVAVQALSEDQECIDGVMSGKFTAVSTDRTILEGFKHAYGLRPEQFGYPQGIEFEVLDLPLGQDERLGVGVRPDDPSLEMLVDDILLENLKQGRRSAWQRAYDNNLEAVLGQMNQPPLTNVVDLISHEDRLPPTRTLARLPAALGVALRSRRR